MEYYRVLKKKQTIDACNNLDEFPGNYAEWKKSIPKGYTMQDLCNIFLNDRSLEKVSGC